MLWQNCFEMYGADFMISDDFRTWLIEMNASPCMAPSTPITAHLVAEVTEDLMKGTPATRAHALLVLGLGLVLVRTENVTYILDLYFHLFTI